MWSDTVTIWHMPFLSSPCSSFAWCRNNQDKSDLQKLFARKLHPSLVRRCWHVSDFYTRWWPCFTVRRSQPSAIQLRQYIVILLIGLIQIHQIDWAWWLRWWESLAVCLSTCLPLPKMLHKKHRVWSWQIKKKDDEDTNVWSSENQEREAFEFCLLFFSCFHSQRSEIQAVTRAVTGCCCCCLSCFEQILRYLNAGSNFQTWHHQDECGLF